MALSQLKVFSDQFYRIRTEILRQQTDAFNSASEGAITLSPGNNQGDFSTEAFWGLVNGLIQRRNPYNQNSVAEKEMYHIAETAVKIGSRLGPVRLDDADMKWIRQDPSTRAAALAQQAAKEEMADMLNTALGAVRYALSNEADVIHDESAASITLRHMNRALGKFGDARNDLRVWTMHSDVLTELYDQNLANNADLFNYGTVNITRDPFGKLFIVTDSPALIDVDGEGDATGYASMALTPGAVMLEQNGDFHANEDERNGNENIRMTYQAEWSWQAALKGFTWDKTSGGKAPNNAAIMNAANWSRTATSHKDLAGVLLLNGVPA